MNVNDMGVAELRLAVQELRRYPAEVTRLEAELKQLREELSDSAREIASGKFTNSGLIAAQLRRIAEAKDV